MTVFAAFRIIAVFLCQTVVHLADLVLDADLDLCVHLRQQRIDVEFREIIISITVDALAVFRLQLRCQLSDKLLILQQRRPVFQPDILDVGIHGRFAVISVRQVNDRIAFLVHIALQIRQHSAICADKLDAGFNLCAVPVHDHLDHVGDFDLHLLLRIRFRILL